MTLGNYLSNVVAGVRQEVRYSTIEVWKETKTTHSANDAYGRIASMTSGARAFSGSMGWTKTRNRERTAGGTYDTGEVQISAALSEKDTLGISLTDNGIYLVAEGVRLKIIRITEAAETKDMVIICDRISE